MKLRKPQHFEYRGHNCITNINNRDFYIIGMDISLKEYIEVLTFS